MAEFDCKKCLHEKVCALWASRESQDASCFCTDGCDYFTPTLTPPNEWVSVEERLPEKKQDVLMLFKSGNMAVGWWHDVDEHVTFWCAYTDDGFYTDCDDMPVYWMPLPAPPDRRPPEGEEDA